MGPWGGSALKTLSLQGSHSDRPEALHFAGKSDVAGEGAGGRSGCV